MKQCGHCSMPITQGGGTLNGVDLCHDEGPMDCYHLVTVWGHPLGHLGCMGETFYETHPETVSETVYETCPTPHHTTPSNKGLGLGTSLRAGDLLGAATMTILSIRPDWREDHTRAVLARDTRPWRVVVAAALRCALDPRCEHPSRIETTNPHGDALPTPIPPPVGAVFAAIRRLDEETQP